ncbi:MAG: GGDEF domain-containing protein, partial [Arcobacteraceae bacterium]|nr:GGDEF domain-containing protein [Arcobacteraceae bacterium]
MRQKFFIKNPLYLILSTLAIAMILVLLLYTTVKLEEKIEKRMIEISTSDVMAIAHNSATAIKNKLDLTSHFAKQIQNNEALHQTIEKKLSVLLTQNIKYSYLLYRDKKGIFR